MPNDNRLDLLARLVKQQNAEKPVKTSIPVRQKTPGTDNHVPMSFAQERLWFVDQLIPGTPVYNVPYGVRLTGALDITALERSLNVIAGRHEVLRTRFVSGTHRPVGIVDKEIKLSIEVFELHGNDMDDLERKALTEANREIRTPFDISKPPLIRALVWRLAENDYLFVLLLHHIVCEAWSIQLILEEVEQLYPSFLRNGSGKELEALPIQFSDYAAWERTRNSSNENQNQVDYWLKELGGNAPELQLPKDRPRPARRSGNGRTQYVRIPREQFNRFTTLCNQERVTVFVGLLALFKLLLYRYTGQTDVLVGSPVSTRNRKELEKLVGFFVGVLVYRSDLGGDPEFAELLKRVKDTVLEGIENQEVPFEQIVNSLNVERSSNQNPIFQVMLVLQNTATLSLQLPGIENARELKIAELNTSTAKMDLTMILEESPDGLTVMLEYDTDLFNEEKIQRMLEHYHNLLNEVAANANLEISKLDMLSEPERDQIIAEWNNTHTDYPRDETIHRVFESQAARTPEATAVLIGEESLSYAELNRRANQLAHHLKRLGVSADVKVGLSIDRSLDMVVGLLGVLKAGGAYVPLDPSNPAQRLAFMLQDADASVLLTHSHLAESLPAGNARLVCLDTDWSDIAKQPADNLQLDIGPRSLAYVIYTSGSTGRPKGTCVEHRSILRLVKGANYVAFGPNQRVLVMAPVSFDASTYELWGPLLSGGRCVLYPDRVPTGELVGQLIAEHGITDVFLTTALFNTFVDTVLERLKPLKTLLTGGESHSITHFARALEVLEDTQLVHVYGPTETTTFATAYPVPKKLANDVQNIPIGRPIANTTAYILNSQLRPVPVGTIGELYIGGDGVSRGYLNQPELTAERFVKDPFCRDAEARLYRTGDLVRWRDDGEIEFVGREDDQVKIRGFRIELGEIEAALANVPGVGEQFVSVRANQAGGKRLVAYVVPEAKNANLSTSALRDALVVQLPE